MECKKIRDILFRKEIFHNNFDIEKSKVNTDYDNEPSERVQDRSEDDDSERAKRIFSK